jgi:hypothetical protein
MCVTYQVSDGMNSGQGQCDVMMSFSTNPMLWLFFGLGVAGGIVLIAGIIFVVVVLRKMKKKKKRVF